jgi:hypothetical protein
MRWSSLFDAEDDVGDDDADEGDVGEDDVFKIDPVVERRPHYKTRSRTIEQPAIAAETRVG